MISLPVLVQFLVEFVVVSVVVGMSLVGNVCYSGHKDSPGTVGMILGLYCGENIHSGTMVHSGAAAALVYNSIVVFVFALDVSNRDLQVGGIVHVHMWVKV